MGVRQGKNQGGRKKVARLFRIVQCTILGVKKIFSDVPIFQEHQNKLILPDCEANIARLAFVCTTNWRLFAFLFPTFRPIYLNICPTFRLSNLFGGAAAPPAPPSRTPMMEPLLSGHIKNPPTLLYHAYCSTLHLIKNSHTNHCQDFWKSEVEWHGKFLLVDPFSRSAEIPEFSPQI